MPAFPTPQLVVTPANQGLEGRAIPVCLAGVGGGTHTVVLRPPCTHASVWQQLHEKGVDPAHHWERAHAAGYLTFRDQTGTVLETWTDSDQLEWAELSADNDDWNSAEVDYAGGEAIVWRLAAPETTTSTTTGYAAECTDAEPHAPPALPESDPPALLLRAPEVRQGKATPDMFTAEEPYVLPEYLDATRFDGRAVEQFSWGAEQAERRGFFTVFDTQRHVTLIPKPAGADIRAIVRAAASGAPFAVRSVQILMACLPGLPRPQVVLARLGERLDYAPIPWDARGPAQTIRTVLRRQGEDFTAALERLRLALPDHPQVIRGIRAGRLAVVDVMGLVGDFLPADLDEVQHFAIEPALFPAPPPLVSERPESAGVAGFEGPTSTTTTPRPARGVNTCQFTLVWGDHAYSIYADMPCRQLEAVVARLFLEIRARFTLCWRARIPRLCMVARKSCLCCVSVRTQT